jgi:hypothetical protein
MEKPPGINWAEFKANSIHLSAKMENCSYLTLHVYPDGVIQYTGKNASTPEGIPPEQTLDTFTW